MPLASWPGAPLADALYEKALDGVTETIAKDGEVVAERHRYDSRLSIAVLHRLDKRCDRAAEMGGRHLALVRHWDEWMALVGRGEEQAGTALLESAPHHQLHQLPLGESLQPEEKEPQEIDLSDRCWKNEDPWMTDFPPPPGFDGWQQGKWTDHNYQRECSAEEAAILDADRAAAEAEELANEANLRDAWFRLRYAENEAEKEEEA